MMIRAFLQHVAAFPWVYDLIRYYVGLPVIEAELEREIRQIGTTGPWVLDIGGGTGLHRPQFPSCLRYVCLDTDSVKLRGFGRKFPLDYGVLADATRLPVRDGAAGLVLMSMVAHHLPDHIVQHVLVEIARSLAPDGRLIVIDQLWPPTRWIGKVIWRYDRGAYPRTVEALQTVLEGAFIIERARVFEIAEPCLISVAVPRNRQQIGGSPP